MKLTKQKLQQIIKESIEDYHSADDPDKVKYFHRAVPEDPLKGAAEIGVELAKQLFEWWEKYDFSIPQDFPRNELKKIVDMAKMLKDTKWKSNEPH